MAAKYPPYINGYGNIPKLFNALKEAAVPTKFTTDFMHTILGFKSSSYRPMIPLLKKLGFIDQSNVPTQVYRDYRDASLSGEIMAECLKKAYSALFASNEYAHKLKREELLEKLRSLTGAAAEDKNVTAVAGTFMELVKLGNFEGKTKKSPKKTLTEKPKEEKVPLQELQQTPHHNPAKLGISYTINLNLPATTEIEVFNAIFKSLKEHIINEK